MVANNSCANSKIGAFIRHGKLPGNDSVCPTEAGPFGITIANLTAIATASTIVSKYSSRSSRMINFR